MKVHGESSCRGAQRTFALKLMFAVLLSIASAGCKSGGFAADSSSGLRARSDESSRKIVHGDWNDLEAAVLAGAESAECAVRNQTRLAEDKFVFDLKTIRDLTATLTATRVDQGITTGYTEHENATIKLECRVEPFGDRQLEARIIRGVAARFEQLRGVEWAPR